MDKGTKIFYKKGKQEIKTAYVVAWNDHPYNQTYFVASDNPDDKTSKKFLIPKSQVIKNPKSNPEMTNETLRMQLLSGVITESEYKAKLEELKKPLNENFVGMGMVGNIFDREKTDYELAFEHFTKGTSLNEYMEDEMPEAPSHEETDAAQVYEEEVEEAMVNPNTSDRVSYLENTLDMVWKRGRGNNPIDFKDLAQSIVNDMFDDLFESKNKEEVEENIHNTAQMGGILGGRNFSAEAEEDKKAAFEIEDLIQSGVSKEEAIQKVSDKYRLQPSYLSRKYNLYVLKEENLEKGKKANLNEYDDFDTESSSAFFSQLANNLKNFLKNEIDLSDLEIDGVKIPEEETLEDVVDGMMEVLGVVMKGKAYTIGEKDVDPGFLNRFK